MTSYIILIGRRQGLRDSTQTTKTATVVLFDSVGLDLLCKNMMCRESNLQPSSPLI